MHSRRKVSKIRKLSYHIPFDIQSEIIKNLPVKSLLQFRSVSKQWKSFIDNPKFIKNYHVNHANPQHHLLVRYELDSVETYTWISDNNIFPQQKAPLTAPESISLLKDASILNSVNGLLCFFGFYEDHGRISSTMKVVIWNPTIRKSVGIVVPRIKAGYIVVGFGICPETSDPKLVKFNVSSMWVVEVFTLSTRVWKTVYMGAPFKSCDFLMFCQVFVSGVIYFLAYNDPYLNGEGKIHSYFVISFDLKSEKFGEVCIPERLVHTPRVNVVKLNESLGLLEYYKEGDMKVCGVWSRKDDANKTFSKIYTVKVEGKSLYHKVLCFRYNGEVVMERDDDNFGESRIEVYEPFSGHANSVGIKGKMHTLRMWSYTETLLLLDEPDSIIH